MFEQHLSEYRRKVDLAYARPGFRLHENRTLLFGLPAFALLPENRLLHMNQIFVEIDIRFAQSEDFGAPHASQESRGNNCLALAFAGIKQLLNLFGS